jgi:chromate reductase, NAD(P)H dehydrogenase (quinone)
MGVTPNRDAAGLCRVLAISGSLRRVSSNTTLLNAAVSLAPFGVDVSLYAGLADIPPFNPDLDGEEPPAAVAQFRAALDAADALLISTPEYAHGVPGALKNAFDWIVGSGEIIGKPIALLNAAPHATMAQASLAETLRTMSAVIVGDGPIAVPLSGRRLDVGGIIADEALAATIRAALATLVRACGPDASAGGGAAK